MTTINDCGNILRSRFSTAVVIAVAALLAGCTAAEAPDCGGLKVSDAWVRQAPPSAPVQAGYFTASNTGSTKIVVHAVASPDYGRVEFHKTITTETGGTSMQSFQSFSIPPRSDVTFTSGGRHLMMFQPRLEYVAGDRLQLQFMCGSQRATTLVTAEVRSSGPVAEDVSR